MVTILILKDLSDLKLRGGGFSVVTTQVIQVSLDCFGSARNDASNIRHCERSRSNPEYFEGAVTFCVLILADLMLAKLLKILEHILVFL